MNKQEVIQKLKENIEKIESFRIKRIGILGFAVRDKMREDSDIDIIVEFKKDGAIFKNFGLSFLKIF